MSNRLPTGRPTGRPRRPAHPDHRVEAQRDKARARAAASRAARRPVHRAIIEKFLSNPCTDCGVQFPLPAMECDHVRGKTTSIGWFRDGNGTELSLRNELDLCEVRCANCHRLRHAAQ